MSLLHNQGDESVDMAENPTRLVKRENQSSATGRFFRSQKTFKRLEEIIPPQIEDLEINFLKKTLEKWPRNDSRDVPGFLVATLILVNAPLGSGPQTDCMRNYVDKP
jgi:hypothetical protein